jgi:hypothetical protein
MLAIAALGCRKEPAMDKSQSPVFGSCINALRMIDGAKIEWAIEHNAGTNIVPTLNDLRPYIRLVGDRDDLGWLKCPEGGTYTIGRIGEFPQCSIANHNMEFGIILVVDESGELVPGARICLRSQEKDILSAETGTNGFITVVRFQASMVDAWSGRTNILTATKNGYAVQTMTNPAIWPARFILKRNH